MVLFAVLVVCVSGRQPSNEHKPDYSPPNRCESCKYVVREIETRLWETGKDPDGYVETTGHGKGPRVKYKTSETRLIDTMDGLCDRILTYRIHKEHKDSRRFGRGQTETSKALEGLVRRGVEVKLDLPIELLDEPSAEISKLKQECEQIVEHYEDDIEHWYFHEQQTMPLMDYLCVQRVLKSDEDQSCLTEGVGEHGKKNNEVRQKAEL